MESGKPKRTAKEERKCIVEERTTRSTDASGEEFDENAMSTQDGNRDIVSEFIARSDHDDTIPAGSEQIADVDNRQTLEHSDILAALKNLEDELKKMRRLFHGNLERQNAALIAENDTYRETVKRSGTVDALHGVAWLYVNYRDAIMSVVDGFDDQTAKLIGCLFDDILRLLGEEGISLKKSEPGDAFDVRNSSKVRDVLTADKSQENLVAESQRVGFYTPFRSLIQENVALYRYEPGYAESLGEISHGESESSEYFVEDTDEELARPQDKESALLRDEDTEGGK